MKFNQLVQFAKDNDIYVESIEFGPYGQFIGFVFVKNNKYKENEELARRFAKPIQAEA